MKATQKTDSVELIRDLLEECKPFMVFETNHGVTTFSFRDPKMRKAIPLYNVDLEKIKRNIFQLPRENSELACAILECRQKIKESSGPMPEKVFASKIKEELEINPSLVLKKMPVGFTNDPSEAHFNYFDLNQINEGSTDAWDEFISRLEPAPYAKEIFMAWVYSVFLATNSGRQALVLSGKGQDGKSVVINAIRSFIGSSAGSVGSADLKNTEFVYANFLGKRLITYPDCKNRRIISFEIIHSLTGGDEVLINPKNEKPFSAKIHAKLLVAMNCTPVINDEDNETSRLIFIKVAESKNKNDPDWEDRLKEEMPAFLWSCKPMYDKYRNNKHGNLGLPKAMFDFMKDTCTSDESEFFEYFIKTGKIVLGESQAWNKLDLKNSFKEVLSKEASRFGIDYPHKFQDIFDKFFKWLGDKHGVRETRINDQRVIKGVGIGK